MNYEPIAGLSC